MRQARCSRPLILYANADEAAESDCACAVPSLETNETARLLIGSASDFGQQAGMAESDCACADADGIRLDANPITGERLFWRRAPELYLMPLPAAQTLAFNPQWPSTVAVLNRSARRILDSFALPTNLSQAASALSDCAPDEAVQAGCRLAALGMIEPVNTSALFVQSDASVLTAWLHVTNACNLRCAYCYVAKSGEAMDEAIGLAAVDAIVRSATHRGFKAIKLKYAGGEATLNFRLIQLLHEYAQAQTTAHGLTLQEVILSNGIGLSPAMLDFARDAGMRLMISLDGLGAEHDAQRPLANGAPSASLVQRTIQRACERGLHPHISITVSPANAASLAHTVRFVLDHDLLFNLNFVRGEAAPSFRKNLVGGWETGIIAGIHQALAVIEERLPRQRLIDGLLDRTCFTGRHSLPCGAGHNYLAIGPRGQIASCHMVLNRPINDIWRNNDPVNMPHQDGTRPRAVAVEERAICRTCLWRYVCAGGCPLLANLAEYKHDVPSLYCKVYQSVLPKLLRLEGLRLLRWQVRPEE